MGEYMAALGLMNSGKKEGTGEKLMGTLFSGTSPSQSPSTGGAGSVDRLKRLSDALTRYKPGGRSYDLVGTEAQDRGDVVAPSPLPAATETRDLEELIRLGGGVGDEDLDELLSKYAGGTYF